MIEQDFVQQLGNAGCQTGETVLLACSAGVDSTALALLFGATYHVHQLHGVIVHINHGWRGDLIAQIEKQHIMHLALALQLDYVIHDIDPCEWHNLPPSTSKEAKARQLRYAILQQYKQHYQAKMVLTAHHANDQVETVYMRMLQHSQVSGLGGIRLVHQYKVRPLLPFFKSQLIDYVQQAGWSWHEDASNDDQSFLRNKVRHQLQAMQAIDAQWLPSMLHVAYSCQQAHDMIEHFMQVLYAQEQWQEHQVLFPWTSFISQPLPIQHRLIYRWFDHLMTGHVAPDFRLPKRFVATLQVCFNRPVLLSGYGLLVVRKKKTIVCQRIE